MSCWSSSSSTCRHADDPAGGPFPQTGLIVAALRTTISRSERAFVDVKESFPEQCQKVLEDLALVFQHDAQAKEQRLSATDRLHLHQEKSAPIMEGLKEWMQQQMEQKADNFARVLVKSGRATGVEKGGGFNFASWSGWGFSQSREFADSAMGKATMKAIASIATDMRQWEAPAISGRAEVAGKEAAERERNVAVSQAEKRRVRGEVLMVDDDKVWLSLGTEQGVQKGDRLRIHRAIEKKNRRDQLVAIDYQPVMEVEIGKVQKDRSWAICTSAMAIEEGWPVTLASVAIEDLE